MWLMDHQMNMRIRDEFGDYAPRIPLTASATIVHGNALRIDWETLSDPSSIDISADRVNILQAAEPQEHYGTVNIYARNVNIGQGHTPSTTKRIDKKVDYILGNPPFIGHHYQSAQQKADLKEVFKNLKGAGILDYVSAWYIKAAQYIQHTDIKAAFVSTNSISQGEQVGLLWGEMLDRYKVKIHFAHRTFNWSNEARGNAAVHVVIIGFGNRASEHPMLYDYETLDGEPMGREVKRINPYLVEAPDVIISNASTPICDVPKMVWGNKPTDGGNFLFEDKAEMELFLQVEPRAEKWIRPFVSGKDFLNNHLRYCLWLSKIEPSELRAMPHVLQRVERVRRMRSESVAEATRRKASTPTLFAQISQPEGPYLAIPEVSSERREYIPIAYLSPDIIASNTIQLVPNAEQYHFGVITSCMHMAWMKVVCGRMKSDFRYSNTIVYNNYPWPKEPTAAQVKDVEEKAQAVLDARANHPDSSLADLYDPLTMPPDLMKAHQALDKAVDKCYRTKAFASETERVEFLFGLYGEYVAGTLKNG
jgi:hypothetical protein